MPTPVLSRTEATRTLALATRAAFASESAGIKDPDEVPALATYARMAEIYHAALTQFRRAKGAHARFSAQHEDDDPAHADHQERLRRAQATLNAAETSMVRALVAWREARGESAAERVS